ncbi:uncharacterized protein [Labrus bergylta]|uniref:uncharacterized protein n=1 Tax=Labrus bergylta TaxID=56723 RepID=UPI0033140786
MRMKLVYVPVLLALMSAGLLSTISRLTSASQLPATTAPPSTTAASWTTAGPSGRNLNGKMFTLNFNKGGISLYAPNFTPQPTSWPVPTSYRYHRYNTARPYIPYRYRGYITPTPYIPYRYRGYITPTPYIPYRYRGYNTPSPYIPYRYRGYNTPTPYIPYRYRGYNTPSPYIPYRYRGYITPTPYIPYRYRGYITPTPYIPYRYRGYITPTPYIPYRYRGYNTPSPYIPYKNHRYNTARPYIPDRYRGYITPTPYIPYRYWGYNTPTPYIPYRYRGYNTARPYIHDRYRGYITPTPYIHDRYRGYITPTPYIPYRYRGYITPTPYIPDRNRGYKTAWPYIPDWNLEYITPTPYIPYRDQGYNTAWPSTAPPYTASPPTPTKGVSVCLRLLNDFQREYKPTVFTLSPSTSPLSLRVYDSDRYALAYSTYSQDNILLRPDIRLWSNTKPEIWTRICVTVDGLKNVAQMFKGPDMSIRKMLSTQYVWSGEPVIEFPAFDGQLTDVQVWDYPLRYKEVFNYMTRSTFESWSSGNVLTWSSINYSFRGNALLEDVYENQAKQRISSSRGRGRRPKEKKMSRKCVKVKDKKQCKMNN